MKTYLFALAFLCSLALPGGSATGQTLEVKNRQLQQQVDSLKKENEYFRKTLGILDAKLKAVTSDNIEFWLLSCAGNKADRTVTLEFLLLSKTADKAIQFSPDEYATGIDLQGNAYEPENIKIGTKVYANTLTENVPLKLVFRFKNVGPDVALFRLILVKYFISSPPYDHYSASFKDISISWK